MESIQIDILNPKAKKLLKGLADLNLIRITTKSTSTFTNLLNKLRNNSNKGLTLEEITAEVEKERAKRIDG
jgi:hypothetical protein